jgi:hypothetical protein
MAENYTPTPVSTFTNDTSAVNTVNSNFTAISTAFTDCLSLSGVSPNQMKSNLDMNSNQIINLPSPATVNSPARLIDVVLNPTITVPPVGTSGSVVGLLNANNTYSGTSTFTGSVSLPSGTVTGTEIANTTITGTNIANATITGTNIASSTIASSNIITNTISNSNLRTSAGLSVIGNTGTSSGNVADIVGTTRQTLAVNTAGTGLVFAQPRGDQLLGTSTNDNATAGNVGEFITSQILFASPVSLTTATAANITTISLTAGDWDVWGQAGFTGGTTTTTSSLAANTSSTTASVVQSSVSFINNIYPASVLFNSSFNSVSFAVPVNRFSLSATTTIYLSCYASFATSTCSAFGTLSARRVR